MCSRSKLIYVDEYVFVHKYEVNPVAYGQLYSNKHNQFYKKILFLLGFRPERKF